MNVKDFLQSKFSRKFEDATLVGIMLERGIPLQADFDQVTKMQLDLAKADLFEFLATFTSQGSESVKKGSWSRTTATVSTTPEERKMYKDAANKIYRYYGESTDYSMKDQTNDW